MQKQQQQQQQQKERKKERKSMSLKKKTTPRQKKESSGNGEEKGKRSSLASAFDKAKPSGAIDDGKYAALIIDMGLNKPSDKGQSAFVRYEIADEGDFQGQEVVQFYSLLDADGNEMKGCGYLKRDLAILGYGDVRFAEIETAFSEIKEEMPGVNITIKNNPPYTNAYLGSLNEDDIIDDWKNSRPEKPY